LVAKLLQRQVAVAVTVGVVAGIAVVAIEVVAIKMKKLQNSRWTRFFILNENQFRCTLC
jgi:hypothetical protein